MVREVVVGTSRYNFVFQQCNLQECKLQQYNNVSKNGIINYELQFGVHENKSEQVHLGEHRAAQT